MPKDSFAGRQMHTPLGPLHRAFFNGEALWTYLATPFAFAMDGFRVEETEPWQEGNETWRLLRVYFPGSIETHCQVQDSFFDREIRAPPSRLQRQYRRWFSRRTIDAGIYRGQRRMLAEQASRLHARPRSASDPGYAHGIDRRQRRCLLLDGRIWWPRADRASPPADHKGSPQAAIDYCCTKRKSCTLSRPSRSTGI